ncbi:HAD-IIIC family phosphatase [Heyndrickxia acidicola]|uniref:HAD-IIIC family phosphatase n=1 Tax=Heyndrickxia acidicola TaxID=209389 RepID=A0ABU6ML69_9BACI|nr:HAD-IIIC family phosphatase [Heyndrickxia acidicola]MED1204711.1 HAD-IIIC family phosphatase [Heyndrickxia acidicola]
MKLALMSNVNIDSIGKKLRKKVDIYTPTGYGVVLEELINPNSNLWVEGIDTIFLYIDLWELTDSGDNLASIEQWLSDFKSVLKRDCTYFIFNADWRGGYSTGYDGISLSLELENKWNTELNSLCDEYNNCYTFNFKSIIEEYGRGNIYSDKVWLLGKVPFSSFGEKAVIEEMELMIQLLIKPSKKVLLLDLDNTLWGGVIGEDGLGGIQLGKEGKGAAFYYFQKKIKAIKEAGTLLCIVSKNNYDDVKETFEKHPEIILTLDDFTVVKANWERKSKNILDIASELNLSPDSFVFIDDNPVERKEVSTQVTGITVPEFPPDVSKLTSFANDLFKRYFSKLRVTTDDLAKAKNYADNFNRKENQKKFSDFDDFLKSLKIKVDLVENNKEFVSRIHQLINKTNQFNLTTQRYTLAEVNRMLEDETYLFYLFNVSDCFGDNGQTALVLFNKESFSIELFIMSCRIMGRKIENYIINFVEEDLIDKGFKAILSKYVFTPKSKPVMDFFDGLGYECFSETDTEKKYRLVLKKRPKRSFIVAELEKVQ